MPRWASWRSTRSQRSVARAVTSSSGTSTVAASTAASIAATRKSSSARLPSAVADFLADVGAQLLERVELGGLGGEVVVELGQDFLPHLLDLDLEDRVFAGQVLGLVVVGEGDLDLALLAGLGAGQLLLEALDQLARSRAPAGSRRPCRPRRRCRRAGPRSRSAASRPRRPRARPAPAGRSPRGSARPRCRRSRRAPRVSALPTSRPLYSPSLAGGRTPTSNLNSSGSPSSSGVETISMLGSPIGLTPESSSARSYHSGSASRIASCSTGAEAEPLDHQRGRRLALAEAGHPHLLRHRAGGAGSGALDVVGGNLDLDLDARVGQLFDGGLHRAR